MAHRIPSVINSDHLTAMAFVAQLCAGSSYAWASKQIHALWLVNVFLVLNWLGDSLDGTLARIRNQQRPRYGFYVDHLVDTFGALALMAGLGCSTYVHWQIAAALLVSFYALSIESFLATHTIGLFHISHGPFGPTEIRILLFIGNSVLLVHPRVTLAGHSFLLFDVAGVLAMAAMAAMLLLAAVHHTLRLYREEVLS
jgi:phosphatidylglycerophosphate synthase